MTDDILDDIRECIELIANAEQQCARRGQQDVCLTTDGAHRIIATLDAAADEIERAV